ncbi:MAG: NAD(P)/FAD-dependent oxidoreductase [Verrucomicrobiales bacterium]|nr:NAD(P)/FAD-dependent oxidoreductase [Verrucomicrobiales bacterium]
MPNSAQHYELIIIGGGSAGYAAARTAANDFGLTTAVIDGADPLGGLCILRGCMPSKALIESSNRCRDLRDAAEFGLLGADAQVDLPAIIQRKRRLIEDFSSYRQEQLENGKFDLIRGTASFVDEHSLQVRLNQSQETLTITADAICIATGSHIDVIQLPGLEKNGFLTSDDILDAQSLPDHIAVLGGGAIALEMACYLEGIGKKVTVIQRSGQLLRGCDADVAQALEAGMASHGIEVFTGTGLRKVESRDGQKVVHFEQAGQPKEVICDDILYALGRAPNTQSLNLDAIKLEMRARHIATDSSMATSIPHIYAAGDVTGPHEIVHIAIEQGEILAQNAAILLGKCDKKPRHIDYRLKLYGIFSTPQVAWVGLTSDEAIQQGIDFSCASYPFNDHGKSMIMNEMHGFVKLMQNNKTGELIGAVVVGPEAVDLIHELVVAMYFRATAKDLASIPHYHPTLSEIWTYPAEELAEL